MGFLVKPDNDPQSGIDGNKSQRIVLLNSEGQQLSQQVIEDVSISQSQGGQDIMTKTNFVKSPMPGTVVKVFVEVGQEVKEGDALISVESMKMEYLIRATHDAKVQEIRVGESQFVQIGEQLIIFEKQEEEN